MASDATFIVARPVDRGLASATTSQNQRKGAAAWHFVRRSASNIRSAYSNQDELSQVKAADCIFYPESNGACDDRAKPEHLIQEGLGGSLSSSDLICSACNGFFGERVDPCIVDFYRPIISHLAPLLPGRAKKKAVSAKSTVESDSLRVSAGGVVDWTKISRRYGDQGALIEVVGPAGTPESLLRDIVSREGGDPSEFKFCDDATVSSVLAQPEYTVTFALDANLARAVCLDLLEFLRYSTLRVGLPDLARETGLATFRCAIRQTTSYFDDRAREVPFAPIEDLLESLFQPCVFAHRLAISFDPSHAVLVLAAQFVDTMPWVFLIESPFAHPDPFTFLYKRALVDGENEFLHSDTVELSAADVRWRQFGSSVGAIRFAQQKFMQAYFETQGRAVYELDMRSDAELLETFARHSDYHRSQQTKDPVVAAIIDTMRSRYRTSIYLDDVLQRTQDIVHSEGLDAAQTAGAGGELLRVFRLCLGEIKKTYGLPDSVRRIGPATPS